MKIRKYVIQKSEDAIIIQVILSLFLLLPLCYVLTNIGITDAYREFINLAIVGISTICMLNYMAKMHLNGMQLTIFFCGYLLRLIVMLIDIYAANYVTILHSGDDAIGFYNVAVELYETGVSERTSVYAEFLRDLFRCFGENRLLVQFTNILCYVATLILVIKACDRFRVKTQYKEWIMLFMAFLPNYICLSSILLRESLMIFLDTFAVYLAVCWMDEGRWEYLVLSLIVPIPAILLHSASLGVWIGCFIAAAFWNTRKRKFGMSVKTMIFMLSAGCLFIIIWSIPSLQQMVFAYLPREISIEIITGKYFVSGGSDYLMNIEVNTWGELAVWTVIRMVYFVFSPMPTDWRGLQDVAAFAIDSVPTFVFIIGMLNGIRKRNDNLLMLLPILVCILVVGIFAWGTSNAGTAMRHRALLIGIFAIAYCISKSSRTKEGDKSNE